MHRELTQIFRSKPRGITVEELALKIGCQPWEAYDLLEKFVRTEEIDAYREFDEKRNKQRGSWLYFLEKINNKLKLKIK
jgi:transcription initiation factor IIE alpha subunit